MGGFYKIQLKGDDVPHGNDTPFLSARQFWSLSAEAVEGLSLTLEGVDDVHRRDGLAARVLRVGDRIADDILEEDPEHASGLLIDEAGDALDAATTSEATNGGLSDTLDVVAEDLAVALGAPLSESLASFATSSHVAWS